MSFTSTYDAAVPAKSGVGDYSWSPSGQTSDNYNITYNNGIIKVVAKDITDDDVDIAELADVTYNKTDQKPAEVSATYLTKTLEVGAAKDYQLSYYKNPTINEETGEITAAGTLLEGDAAKFIDAGTYCVKVTANDGGNYTGDVLKKFVVKKKAIGIRTVNKEVTYNGANQATAVTFANNVEFAVLEEGDEYPGIKAEGSEDLGIHLEKEGVTVAQAIEAGTYNIVFDDYDDVEFKNYDFSGQVSSQGKLIIKQKDIILTAKNKSKNYGTPDVYVTGREAVAADVDVTYATGEAAIEGHEITSYPWLQREEGEEKADYALNLVENDDNKLVIKAGETDVTKNYKPQFVPGTFTIGVGVIAIWANSETITYGKTYGEAKAMLNATIDGMTELDAEQIQAQVNAALTITGVSEDLEDDDLLPANAAGYAIKFNTSAIEIPEEIMANYGEVHYYDVSSLLKVNKKALTVKPATQAHLVGETVIATANANTIEFEEAVATEADEAAIYAALTLEYSLAEGLVNGEGKLNDAAAEHGKDADANDTGDGIYVDGIVITAATITAYNEAANNYTLTAVPGQLTVSATDVVEFDAKAEDNSTEDVFDNANRKLNVTILNKKLKAGRWYTISLPFATTPFEFCGAIGGYAIFDRLQKTGDKLSFKISLDAIPAYTPFLVKVEKEVDLATVVFNNVYVETPTIVETEANNVWQIVNTIDNAQVDGLVYWLEATSTESIVLGRSTTGATFRGFDAYITTLDGNPRSEARIFIEEPDGSTTAISAIAADGEMIPAEGWFTLNGVKLQSMPTEKGVYINNGKKVVIK